jgi:hypothetical protein
MFGGEAGERQVSAEWAMRHTPACHNIQLPAKSAPDSVSLGSDCLMCVCVPMPAWRRLLRRQDSGPACQFEC